MKKKTVISPVLCVLLLLLVAMFLYIFLYFMPAKTRLTTMRAETALQATQAQLYRQYLDDPSPLQKEIDDLEKEIKRINAEEFINDSNVSLMISDAIQRYEVALTSVSLDSVTSYEGFRALPINLSFSGSRENVLDFIRHFETDEEGAFIVAGVSMDITAHVTSTSMILYLCTPAV